MTLILVSACSKSSPQSGTETPTAGAVAAVAPSAVAAPEQAWCVGSWKGDFAVSRRVSTTTKKEGGPGAWEKDNGEKLSGPGNAELSIDAKGEVTGSLKGALGDLDLRGKIDGDELRANLVAKSDDPTAIHNGNLVLLHDADVLKGRLMAASGDALVMRQAEVSLKKASP